MGRLGLNLPEETCWTCDKEGKFEWHLTGPHGMALAFCSEECLNKRPGMRWDGNRDSGRDDG